MIKDNTSNILGANTADNLFDSSAVVANRDGSIIERIEYMMNPGEGSDATKVLATIANGVTDLFTFTGVIRIKAIVAVVTGLFETKATTLKLMVKSDALTAVDICANVDATAAAVGTLMSITGTANAAVLSANGGVTPGQAGAVFASCITGGKIQLSAGAANTGTATFYVLWEAVSPGATLVGA